ncbi:Vesicle transport protein SEC20 [Orchesella cincta]|uniref:Vesicle transport protein SEC20 n=1 Tax=Orchesella cincta TaxID=48709 RepID=A0A1D2MIM4_ORCCI|nr:Vesicle transport protein SEC20 [Orchesella cincta]
MEDAQNQARRRLFGAGPIVGEEPNHYHHVPRRPGAPDSFSSNYSSPLSSSPSSPFNQSQPDEPIRTSFSMLRKLNNGGVGGTLPPEKGSYSEILSNPETHFDKIIQRAKEYLVETQNAINRLQSAKGPEFDLLDAETQIQKTIAEVSKIALQLRRYVEETSARRTADTTVSPRVLSAVKSRETSVEELMKSIRETKKELQVALTVRERKDLLNAWSPFDHSSRRQRDAEEISSDSTERLLNSKRILLETVQASSSTLGSLATSSQSIQKNDSELQTQNSMVSTARSLLKKYGRRASTDKLLIWLGFIFFGCVVLYVVSRRLL